MKANLSHYRILEKIGAGGMGEVFRAHDDHLDRDVAIKMLPPDAPVTPAAKHRFQHEALALSKLNHPNIAAVYDFDLEEGTEFLVEELVEGMTLESMVEASPLSTREIVSLGKQLLSGLQAAHEHRILHCDLKPANLRITPDGRLKILDFGLAMMLHSADSVTVSTTTAIENDSRAGTLPYMAPEQLLGERLDERTDLWAVGCVLYEIATGEQAFHGSGATLMNAILRRDFGSGKRADKLSPALRKIVAKCLEKDPHRRYQNAQEIARDLERLNTSRRKISITLRLLAAAVALALMIAAWIALPTIPIFHRIFIRPKPAIAVLPFVNVSSDPQQEYFSDGLAEELINDLAQMNGIRVTGRTSSFRFKGRNEDLRAIGRQLDVGYVLEGSVRSNGARVRVAAQLIDAKDGYHLWSEVYDREVTDIFAVQEEIATKVASELKVSLLGETSARPERNLEAYDAYLQGRFYLEKSSEKDSAQAVLHFERATQLDPNYAQAWAALAEARSHQADSGYVPTEVGYREAREAVNRALTIDRGLAKGHECLGWIRMTHDWDWAGAKYSFEKARSLEPGSASMLWKVGTLAKSQGRFAEAIQLMEQAVAVDPLRAYPHMMLGSTKYFAGDYATAKSELLRSLELDPQFPYAHTYLGRVYLMQGNAGMALSEMEQETDSAWRSYGLALAYAGLGEQGKSDAALHQLIADHQNDFAYQIAHVYAYRGERDKAFEWLARAFAQRDGGMTELIGDPMLKNLAGDSRLDQVMEKMNLKAQGRRI